MATRTKSFQMQKHRHQQRPHMLYKMQSNPVTIFIPGEISPEKNVNSVNMELALSKWD